MIQTAPDAALLTQLHRAQGGEPRLDPQADPARAAEEFESFFLSMMIQTMFEGVETPEPFGGGPGEKAWQGLLHEEYGKIIARSGGIGIADNLKAEMLTMQMAGESDHG